VRSIHPQTDLTIQQASPTVGTASQLSWDNGLFRATAHLGQADGIVPLTVTQPQSSAHDWQTPVGEEHHIRMMTQ